MNATTKALSCNSCQNGYILSRVSVLNSEAELQCLDNRVEVIPFC